MRSIISSLISAALILSSVTEASSHRPNLFKRAENIKRNHDRKLADRGAMAAPGATLEKRQTSRFLNDKSSEFCVDGSALPDVPFDVGESYAGLLPISSSLNETRELFFWFFPSSNPNATNEITMWFNGGPGCSSLSGLLTENGPFTWEEGTVAPVQNPYSWTNLTNMVWIEQPVGVGFTQGVPDITNEVELAQEFIGFWKNFVNTFSLEGFDMYITGESYGGYYVPYIADAFIQANDTDNYNLKGVAINDPIIGDETNQQQVVVMPYVDYWANLFYLNQTFLDTMHAWADQCGYPAYQEKYLTFPPPAGPFPVLPDPYYSENYTCDIFDDIYSAVLEVNPCFNIYHITEVCPHPYESLGIVNPGDYTPPGFVAYFNRSDVQAAINAPVGTNWEQCTDTNVFADTPNRSTTSTNSDTSLGPAQDGVLERVIDHTQNVIIGSGNLDMLLNTNGTLLALQNMTWGGLQGLQAYPGKDFYVPYHPEYNGGALAGAGVLGSWGAERGLTFYQVQLSGHELPGYAPGAAYRAVELLLGRIGSLGDVGDFTTESGDYTGTSPIYKPGVAGGRLPRRRKNERGAYKQWR